MIRTVDQLLKYVSPDEALAAILAILQSLGFPATSWEDGGIARTLVELLARLYSDLTVNISQSTKGRYNATAAGDWLTVFAKSHYDNERFDPTPTVIDVLLDAGVSGAGPYSVDVSDSVIVDQDGNTYRNPVDSGVLSAGAALQLRYVAEVARATAVPLSLSFQTPLSGVALSLVDLVALGTDTEKDPRLRDRNSSRWATLSYSGPEDAYKQWALQASPNVTRVRVDGQNPGGPGTVYLYVAGIEQLVAGEEVLVKNYINGTDGVGRRPLCSIVSVYAAVPHVVFINAQIFYDARYGATVAADVVAALDGYFQSLPIGGRSGLVPIAGIYSAVMKTRGVINMALVWPSADEVIGPNEMPDWTAHSPDGYWITYTAFTDDVES
jgi:phage-related baseplate assembly protein